MLVLAGSSDTQDNVSAASKDAKVPHGEDKAQKYKPNVRRCLVSQGMPVPFFHVRTRAWCLMCSSSHGRIAQPLDTPHRKWWLQGRVSHEISEKMEITSSKKRQLSGWFQASCVFNSICSWENKRAEKCFCQKLAEHEVSLWKVLVLRN